MKYLYQCHLNQYFNFHVCLPALMHLCVTLRWFIVLLAPDSEVNELHENAETSKNSKLKTNTNLYFFLRPRWGPWRILVCLYLTSPLLPLFAIALNLESGFLIRSRFDSNTNTVNPGFIGNLFNQFLK